MELQKTSLIDAHDIATALGISDRGVRERANREKWTVASLATRGGHGCRYMYGILPDDVRRVIAVRHAEKNGLAVIDGRRAPSVPKTVHAPDRSKESGLAKYQLVHAFRRVADAAAWGKKKDAVDAFILAYNSQILLPNVFNIIGETSEKTLRALDKKLRDSGNDYSALCDGRGGWKLHGTTKWKERKLPDSAKSAFLQCFCQPSRPSVVMAIKSARLGLGKQGIDPGCDDSTFRRWLRDYEKENAHIICLGREGMKAYHDKFAPYITRDADLLSPGQCLVADGKTLNFFIKHPETGRPCRMAIIVFQDWASRCPVGWQIMPTENTIAIAAAFRHSVITLGRYPDSIYTDNGRAFKAKIFQDTNPDLEEMAGLYARVGTATFFAKPYSGRSKIVERFNRTFQDQLECLMPSFCGDSIQNKPAWMARNETFHRAWHEAKTGGYVPTIREAAHVIERYVNWYVNQPHEGLHGRTPIEVLEPALGPGVPDEQLRFDFMWREIKSPRRCRVTLWGIEYESDALHGMAANSKVMVMYDTANLEQVYMYTPDNRYIGEAYPVEALHPVAKLFGDEVSVDRVKEAIKRQASLAKRTKQQLIELGAKDEDVIGLNALPWREKVSVIRNSSPALPAPELGMDDHEKARLELVVSQAEVEMNEQAESEIERPGFFESEVARYEWCFMAKYQMRVRLSNEDEAYMKYYEITDEYRENYVNRFEDLKMLYGMYGDELKQA